MCCGRVEEGGVIQYPVACIGCAGLLCAVPYHTFSHSRQGVPCKTASEPYKPPCCLSNVHDISLTEALVSQAYSLMLDIDLYLRLRVSQ
jgi:hypothetical protein